MKVYIWIKLPVALAGGRVSSECASHSCESTSYRTNPAAPKPGGDTTGESALEQFRRSLDFPEVCTSYFLLFNYSFFLINGVWQCCLTITRPTWLFYCKNVWNKRNWTLTGPVAQVKKKTSKKYGSGISFQMQCEMQG